MKTTLGGDRLGSGSKNEYTGKHFERSTHNMTRNFRSSMSSGTLVPFYKKLCLPGDSDEFDLFVDCHTLPTVGPLFGSYKLQLDMFFAPIRLYNAALTMNMLNIGSDMDKVFFPRVELLTNNHADLEFDYRFDNQINPSCIFSYLGIRGLGQVTGDTNPATRTFNAVPHLMYWEIFKNYYSNKQQAKALVIHTSSVAGMTADRAIVFNGFTELGDATQQSISITNVTGINCFIYTEEDGEPIFDQVFIDYNTVDTPITDLWNSVSWNATLQRIECTSFAQTGGGQAALQMSDTNVPIAGGVNAGIDLAAFPLENIDKMRQSILQHPFDDGAFVYDGANGSLSPYNLPMAAIGSGSTRTYSMQYSQEGLALKTYQSDLLNNWVNTDWIDGANGVNAVTAIDTSGGSFTLDTLNISQKLYNLLNRTALSGNTYDDWLEAAYDHDRMKDITSPMYLGSLIKELAFQEVVSTAEANNDNSSQPLGTLAGRGRLTDKHKGGKIKLKIDEPGYVLGIVSLTPRINYSQGNDWDINLSSFDDLHVPDLDAIGFQDLITEQMAWSDTELDSDTGDLTFSSAGKQPAWLNYMTDIDRAYGNFAHNYSDNFMILDRGYDVNENGELLDITTYIDPSKFNNIFATTDLTSQNFWMHIQVKCTSRRKMSAKQIPNL